jgi:hypothetical protein
METPMFASPLYNRQPATATTRTRIGEHLSARQLAFQALFKHVSAGAVAIFLFVTLALVTAHRDNGSEPPNIHTAKPHEAFRPDKKASEHDGKAFGNKAALIQ